jgi:hypothetical protein
MGRWTIVNGLLGLIVALLGYEIVRTWARGLPPVAAVAPAAVPPTPHEKGKRGGEKGGGRGAQQAPAAMVAVISDKDLFDVSRRAPAPDEVKAEVQAPVTKPPDGVTVVGVRIFGKDREVFVNDATQNPAVGRRLRAGDQIAGYTVKGIEPTAVTLASPSGDPVVVPLTLDKGGKAGAPGAPGGPPRPPGRPPQPGQAPTSPAAGSQVASPAAGVPVAPAKPGAPAARPAVPPAPGAPAQTQPQQSLPAEVRQKLEQLRQNDKRAGHKK